MKRMLSAFTIDELAKAEGISPIIIGLAIVRLVDLGFVEVCGEFDDSDLYQMTEYGQVTLTLLEKIREYKTNEQSI